MTSILEWFEEYSFGIVLLLVLASALIYVIRIVVEKAVNARFDKYSTELALSLGRRSNFEERVLVDRYSAFTDLTTRLETIATEINRLRHGGTAEQGFLVGNEIVPLTRVYEDLESKRLLLGERLYGEVREAARITLHLANFQHLSPDELVAWEASFIEQRTKLREAADNEFRLSSIKW